LRALALFAEAIADPVRRRNAGDDPLVLMKEALAEKGTSFDELDQDVQEAFLDLFGDLTFEELRMLARLQKKLVALDPDGTLGLTEEVEVGSFATLAKL
jgi:hypothetical protein